MQYAAGIKNFIRRLYLSFNPSNRLIVLDYPLKPQPVYTLQNPHKQLKHLIEKRRAGYAALLKASHTYFTHLQTIKSKEVVDATAPQWTNGYLPGLDILMLYTILNEYKPARYIEIGSGTSTKIVYKARRENALNYTITCIDPGPREIIKSLADEWLEEKLQNVPATVFSSLKENDIVFFDGTHQLLPSSDVMHFFMEVLPVLAEGVIIQLHDIYLPYDYPQTMCDRFYSENYVLGAVLLANPDKYKLLSPNFFISEDEELRQLIATFWSHPNLAGVEKHGGSFWFQVQ